MITPERLRKIDPKMKYLSDKEILSIRSDLYQLAEISIESYLREKDSKNPERLLSK